MVSKIALVALLLVVAVTAVPPGAYGPPAWVAQMPWMPQWAPCDPALVGATCSDCHTKSICTKIGQISKACTDPTLPYCDLGECVATPNAQCAPAVPAVAV